MSRKLNTLTARVGTLVKQQVRYTGWSSDLQAFVAKRLEAPRPTKVQAIEWLCREALLGEEFSLLDIGCGPGVFAHMLVASPLSERVRYTGVDQSEQALAHARATLPDSCTFVARDVLRDGLPPGKYDVIVINEVVEHMPHYQELLDAALALQPRVLIVTTFAVLPEQKKDRFLWNKSYACYMNTYSFTHFYQHLREKSDRVIKVADFGTKRDGTVEFPLKALILFYLPAGESKLRLLSNSE